MIRNYLKTALRSIMRQKSFTLINITGLSVGIAVCFVILLYVQDELSYDRYNKNADRMVRVLFQANINGGKINESNVMPQVAAAMKRDYPEVEDATRLRQYGAQKITYRDRSFKTDGMAFVDPNFFSIFTLPLIEGNAQTALTQPHTLVITRAAAEKYFGKEDPLGKTLTFSNDIGPCTVTGMIDKVPANSHFHFDLFASMTGLDESRSDSWMGSNFFTYVLLKRGADYKSLEAKLPGMVEKYMGPQIQQNMGLSLAQFRTKGNSLGFALQPLTDIHLNSNGNNEMEPGGNPTYVYLFGAVAIFMLLIACINFINLATAGASKRAKEVGVRKVVGSRKADLVRQFLLESGLLVLFSLVIALALVQALLPVFNNISGKDLHMGFNWNVVSLLLLLWIVVSLIAGVYPAFFLSSFKPIAVLKGKIASGNRGFGLRSALVVFQFFISVGLIVGTLVVWKQMKYIQSVKLGYDKDQLLVLPNSYALGNNERLYRDMMLKDPRVVDATISSYRPAGPSNNNNALAYPEGHDNQIMKTIEYHVDDQYIPVFGMQMAAGRNFSRDMATDSTAMIINESAAAAFGWGNAAIGKTIVRENSDRGINVPYHVIGIVHDFHFRSLHEAITPLLMTYEPDQGLIFKIKTADLQGLLADMKKQWDQFHTDEPFTYNFMDDLYSKTYSAEQKTGTILNIFSVLTIFVACLGLFGLATYTAERRTKEIGIRKVLGASIPQITRMLSMDFIRLVFIACLLALPLSYWAMHRWLESFAYRTAISGWILVAASVASLLIALFTISFQSIRSALANPVKSLKTE